MTSIAKIVGWTAVLTSVAFGVSISSLAMWFLVSGQRGDGMVTVNAIIGVGFLVFGSVIAGWVEKRNASMEPSND